MLTICCWKTSSNWLKFEIAQSLLQHRDDQLIQLTFQDDVTPSRAKVLRRKKTSLIDFCPSSISVAREFCHVNPVKRPSIVRVEQVYLMRAKRQTKHTVSSGETHVFKLWLISWLYPDGRYPIYSVQIKAGFERKLNLWTISNFRIIKRAQLK